MSVGVYYASNAVGRLTGTLLSGVLYTYVGSTVVIGMGACLLASTAFALISVGVDAWLTEDKPGSSWLSPFNRCLPTRCMPPASEAGGVPGGEGGEEEGGAVALAATLAVAVEAAAAADGTRLDAPEVEGAKAR